MSEEKELNQDNQNHGLDTLPENERKETQEILDSLAPAKDEDKPEEKQPAKEEAPKEPAEPKDEDKNERRDVALMPAWKHKIAEKQWQDEKADLERKLAEASDSKGKPSSAELPVTEPEKKSESDIDIKALAEELGADESTVAKIIEAAEERAKAQYKPFELSDEDKQALVAAKEYQAQQALDTERALFERDFTKDVLPEIKKEYGDDVPESVIADLKEKLHGIAYTPEYKLIPYNEIYRAKAEFRGVAAEKRKSAESSRGGAFQVSGETVKYEDLDENQIANLSGEDFDKYSDYMARRERKS